MNRADYFQSPRKALRPGFRVQLQAREAWRKMPTQSLKPHQVPQKSVHLPAAVGSVKSTDNTWRSVEGTDQMGRHTRSLYFHKKCNKCMADKEMSRAKQAPRSNLSALRSMKLPALKSGK